MTERDVRVSMNQRWKAAHMAFIDRCKGDFETMRTQRVWWHEMTAPLIREYHERIRELETA